ncbi:MAG: hypothetical protein Q9218_007467 [Villophora microphyllina]
MPPITENQLFESLLDFKNALREWAIERNFTPHILDSDSHRVRAGCRSSPNCPFRIRCNWNEKRRIARVTTCENVHTCISTSDSVAHQNIKRAETGRLKFLVDTVPKLLDVTTTTTTTEIIDAVERKYGQRIPLRQSQKVKRALAGRIHGPCRYCRTGGHSKRNCPMRKEREAAGIMAVPTPAELGMDQYTYADDPNIDPSITNDNPAVPDDRRCSLCFQPGHHRGNCPAETMGPNDHPDGQQDYRNGLSAHQQPEYPIPYDPVNHAEVYGTSTMVTPSRGPPIDQALLAPGSNERSQPRTPQEKQAEAARLMQQAAELMSEASRMNAEAARLTASISVS